MFGEQRWVICKGASPADAVRRIVNRARVHVALRSVSASLLCCLFVTACGGKIGEIDGPGSSQSETGATAGIGAVRASAGCAECAGTGGRDAKGAGPGIGAAAAAAGRIGADGSVATAGHPAGIGTGGRVGSGGSKPMPDPPAFCESIEGLSNEGCLTQVWPGRAPINILLVVDKSHSFGDDPFFGDYPWQELVSSLAEALNEPRVIDYPGMAIGLMLFPDRDVPTSCAAEGCCAMSEYPINVEIGDATESVPAILDVLDSTQPSGLTPMADALELALMYFKSGMGSTLKGDKYVLLISGGGPSCNGSLDCDDDECTLSLDGMCVGSGCCSETGLWCVDWQRTEDKVSDLAAAGVRTIVVGLPGSEPYADWYSGFAAAGQAEAPADRSELGFWHPTSGDREPEVTQLLRDVFRSVTDSCEMPLAAEPIGHGLYVNLLIDCVAVPQGGAAIEAGAGGGVRPANWVIDDSTDPPTLNVLGDYCQKITRDGAQADILMGCPPRI